MACQKFRQGKKIYTLFHLAAQLAQLWRNLESSPVKALCLDPLWSEFATASN